MTCLAAVVVFCITYALILPAITMEGQCDLPEHTHTDACHSDFSTLVCVYAESPGHAHGEECFDEEGNLTCELEESPGHTHGEGCYEI